MSEFLTILSFSWIPLAGAMTFALPAAPLGAILSLRDEILLGLALPPVGAAAIVTAVWVGVPVTQTPVLYMVAVGGILLVSLAMPRKSSGTSPRWRAAFLASVFAAGEAATMLVSSASTRVEAHLQHMLRGELLAVGSSELIGFAALTAVVLGLGYAKRGFLFALAVDEESLGISSPRRVGPVLFGFRVLSAMVIAAGVIWVGPLLTVALLAVPSMFYERRARGLTQLILGVAMIGLAGVLIGFGGSIAWDLPPAPVVVGALFVIGWGWGRLIPRPNPRPPRSRCRPHPPASPHPRAGDRSHRAAARETASPRSRHPRSSHADRRNTATGDHEAAAPRMRHREPPPLPCPRAERVDRARGGPGPRPP